LSIRLSTQVDPSSHWLHEATGAMSWTRRFVRDADLLWQRMIHCAEVVCTLWTGDVGLAVFLASQAAPTAHHYV
jgi:hypothetical protein